MADQQTPPQNGNEKVQNTGTNAGDLLGDISLSFPDAPETPKTEAKQEISDLGDVLVEKSLDAAQEKAESKSMPEISAELTNFGTETIKADTPIANDPINIDLGDIRIPESEEAVPAAITPTATTATEEIKLPDTIPVVHEEESEAMTMSEIHEHNDLVNITLPAEIPAAPIETPAPIAEVAPMPIEPAVEAAPIVEPTPIVEEKPAEPVIVQENPTEANPEGMTLDLDSLTSDIGGQAGAALNTTASTPPAPVEASVVLPTVNLLQAPKKSSKKKALTMAVLFILLLVLGGFVFKTMMPEETEKILATITGTSSPAPIVTINTTVDSGTEIGTLIDTGSNSLTGTEFTGTTITGDTLETPTQEQPTLTLEEANTTLSTIIEESRKNLSTALKANQKNASQILYKVFKDSTNLSEALANISDISTIPDVDLQIANMQTDLHQATIMLNVTSSVDSQS